MALITPVDYTVSSLEFSRKLGKSVMQTLTEIASNYEYGVNEDRRFYFRPYSEKITERFWVGHGDLKSFEPEEIEAKYNAYKVLCGKLTSGDNYIIEVEDVPEGEYAQWGILELSESIPLFGSNLAAGLLIGQLLSDPAGAGLINIVDEDATTEWSSGVYQQIGHFIQADLGSIVSNIGKVVVDSTGIANRTTDFADGFRILISDTISGNDMIDPTEVFASVEVFASNRIEITFPPTNGRYVRAEINDAKPWFWRVDEFEIYVWEIGDISRWAGSQLSTSRESIKKGKLELSKIDRKILPRGKIRVTNKSGSAYYDYPVIATKYHFNAKSGFQCSLQLGETTRSIADELLTMKRQMTERRLMGAARGRGLSSGIYTSPGSNQKISGSMIEAAMLKIYDLADIKNLLTVAAAKILIGEDVLGPALHGIKIIDEQAVPVTRVEIGHLLPGSANYGINTRDVDGVLTVDRGEITERWRKIYEITISANCTSFTLDGFNGDLDLEYIIRTRFVRAGADVIDVPYGLQLGGTAGIDGGNNYGYQYIRGVAGALLGAAGGAQSFMRIGKADKAGEISHGEFVLHARSGYVRTLWGSYAENIPRAGPSWGGNIEFDFWTNTTANITQMKFLSTTTPNGIGVGTEIEIWKRIF